MQSRIKKNEGVHKRQGQPVGLALMVGTLRKRPRGSSPLSYSRGGAQQRQARAVPGTALADCVMSMPRRSGPNRMIAAMMTATVPAIAASATE